MKDPLVSIILFTFNAEKYIRNNLESMHKQDFKDFEILLVDKYSTDKTREIAKGFSKVRVLMAPKERSTQVNFGARKAKGKYLFITGVDIEYHSRYLLQSAWLCEKKGFDAVYTSVLTRNESLLGRAKALERKCYVGDNSHESARFVRRDVFIRLGGYDENLVAGEDYDFQRRLNEAGYKTGRARVVAEYHLGEEETLKQVVKRSFYYGKTFINFFDKHGVSSVSQLSPVRTVFLKNWKLWLLNPVKTLVFVFYKILQYLFGGLGFLYGYYLKMKKNV